MKPYKNIIGLLVALMAILSCITCGSKSAKNTSKNNDIKKNEWLPEVSAPEHYPVEVYQGYFGTDEGQYITIPSGSIVKNGWGNMGSTWLIGDDLKTVPSTLHVIYVSFAESQFYLGEFELPKDKITKLFEKGFINRKGELAQYSTLSVGLAPGGAVSVWIKGAGATVEIGHYQALKTVVAMEDFIPNSASDFETYCSNRLDNLPEESKAVLKAEGIPFGKWTKQYRAKYTWKPSFKHNDNGVFFRFLNDFYNGEFYVVHPENLLASAYQNNTPPKRVAFRWYDKNGVEYGAKVYFDETEIWDAFKKIYANEKTTQAELVLEVDKYNSNLKISLQSENDTISIEKSKIVIYEASK